MKPSQLKPLLINFVNKNINEIDNAKTPSIDLYNYFCLKNRINSEEFSIFSFIPHFVKTYETLKNKKLNKTIFKDSNGKTFRGYQHIELNIDKDLAAILALDNPAEAAVESNVEINEISPQVVLTKEKVIVEQKQDQTQVEPQQQAQPESQQATTSKSSKENSDKKEKIKSYKKIKDWLKARCEYTIGENTFVYILKEDFAKFIGHPTNIINNKAFINHIVEYSLEQWADSNIKKEDKWHQTNSSYIMNLKLKS